MRTILAFAAGAAAGWWYATRTADERKEELEATVARLRSHPGWQTAREAGGEAINGAFSAGRDAVKPLLDNS
jgi:hypothetical protein